MEPKHANLKKAIKDLVIFTIAYDGASFTIKPYINAAPNTDNFIYIYNGEFSANINNINKTIHLTQEWFTDFGFVYVYQYGEKHSYTGEARSETEFIKLVDRLVGDKKIMMTKYAKKKLGLI